MGFYARYQYYWSYSCLIIAMPSHMPVLIIIPLLSSLQLGISRESRKNFLKHNWHFPLDQWFVIHILFHSSYHSDRCSQYILICCIVPFKIRPPKVWIYSWKTWNTSQSIRWLIILIHGSIWPPEVICLLKCGYNV